MKTPLKCLCEKNKEDNITEEKLDICCLTIHGREEKASKGDPVASDQSLYLLYEKKELV